MSFRRQRVQLLDTKAFSAWASPVSLNINGMDDPSFEVLALAIKIDLRTDGATADAQMTAESMGAAWFLEALWRNGNRPMLDNISLAGLDLHSQRVYNPLAFEYDAMAVSTDAANPLHHEVTSTATDELEEFLFFVPFRQPRAANPDDFLPRLDQLGRITLRPSTTADANGYVTPGTSDSVISVYAIGREAKPGTYKVPAQFKVRQITAETGNNVTLDIEGRPLVDCFYFSEDVSNDPVSEEDPIGAYIDGQEVASWSGETGEDLLALLSPAMTGSGERAAIATLRGNTRVMPVVQAPDGWRITELPVGKLLKISFSGRIGAPDTNGRWVITTLYNDNLGAGLARQVPGAATMDAAEVAEAVSRPGVVNAGSIPLGNLGALPAKITTG